MKFDPEKHRRRSIRLQDYDYAQEGAYFVTICTQSKECFFGGIADGQIRWNPVGKMVETVWVELSKRFPFVELDEFIVMPNHFHGILVLTDKADCRGESCIRPAVGGGGSNQGEHKVRPYGTLKGTAGRIVQAFKSISTHEYKIGVEKQHWNPFPERLWQRNYFEHVIRSEKSLNKIREYIAANPSQWETDPENPSVQASSAALEKSLLL